MTPAESARARYRLYALLGRLVVEGVGPRTDATVRALPALAAALPEASDDERAAEHHRVWSLEVFPYESVFLGPSALLGERAPAVHASWAACGFSSRRADLEPDHLGLELACVAFLSAAEADALDDGLDAEPLRALQRRFLDDHLLRWLPAVQVAIRRCGAGFERAVVDLALELAQSHRGDPAPWELDPVPLDLDDPGTGLARIARWLSVPAASGMFLSKAAIARIAARIEVPRGFGSRARMLQSVLFAAADHGRLPEVVGAIDEERAAWQVLGPPWSDRLERTGEVLAQLTGHAP